MWLMTGERMSIESYGYQKKLHLQYLLISTHVLMFHGLDGLLQVCYKQVNL